MSSNRILSNGRPGGSGNQTRGRRRNPYGLESQILSEESLICQVTKNQVAKVSPRDTRQGKFKKTHFDTEGGEECSHL